MSQTLRIFHSPIPTTRMRSVQTQTRQRHHTSSAQILNRLRKYEVTFGIIMRV